MATESERDTRGSEKYPEGEIVLPLGDLFQVIRRRLWVILLAMIVCLGLAVGYSFQQITFYQASIKVLVGQKQGIATDPTQSPSLVALTPTLSEAVATRPVAERVVRSLDLTLSPETIIAGTSSEVIPDTQFLIISYTDTDPRRAQRIVNAIGDAFSEEVSEVSPNVGAITATVWERAAVPQSPISPNPGRSGLIGLVLGGLLGVGLAFLLEYLDDSWQSAEEAERVSGVPTLGVIPELESPRGQ